MRRRLALIVGALSILLGGTVAGAQLRGDVTDVRHYEVQAGDSWFRIADALCPAPMSNLERQQFAMLLANRNGGDFSLRLITKQLIDYRAADLDTCGTPPPPTTTTTTSTTSTTVATTVATTVPSTAPPTSSTSTTVPATTSTTLSPTTSTSPSGSATSFSETFDGTPEQVMATFKARFDYGLYRRDNTIITETSWQGDHDLNCGAPTTSRTINRELNLPGSDPNDHNDWDVAATIYGCAQHVMFAEGDTSGWSIEYMSPKDRFVGTRTVCVSVNLTDLGSRQWFEMGVIPGNQTPLFAADGTANADNSNPQVVIYPQPNMAVLRWGVEVNEGLMRINGQPLSFTNIGNYDNDRATRYPVCLHDNGNGTITGTMKDATGTYTLTVPGRFPPGVQRVVVSATTYTPSKDPSPTGAKTWHFDNFTVSTT